MKRFLSIGECMVEFADLGNGTFAQGFAGDTFNTAWYARRILPSDWHVDYFSAVGDGRISADMLAFMEKSGVGTQHMRRIPGAAPGLYVITLEKGERSFSYWRDTSAAKQLAREPALLERACREADAMFVSGITLAILTPDEADTLLDILAAEKAAGKLVAFDPNFRPRLWAGRSDAQSLMLKAATAASLVLTGCDDEQALFATRDPAAIAIRYGKAGASEIVVKDGGNGATIFAGGTSAHVLATPPAALVDTTAAGDSFNAAYMAARLQGRTPEHAATEAARIAAQVITQHGALVPVAP